MKQTAITMTRKKAVVAFLILVWMARLPAIAAVGNITDVQVDGNLLLITAGSDVMQVEVCRTNVIRVDYRPGGAYAPPTQIIGTTNWLAVTGVTIDAGGDPILVQTDAVRLEIQRNPCRLRLFNADGSRLLVREQNAEGVFFDGVRLESGEASDYYGIHAYYVWDNTSARMVRNSGGTVEAGFQGDAGAPLAFTRNGYGVLIDSDGGQFNIDNTNLTFQFCSQPNILYYLVAGDPIDIMQGFMEISGKPPMLPKWAMGFANTEWGIDQVELTNIVATYRQKQIPIDQYVLDFDWKAWSEDNYGEWRWNTTKFPGGPTGQLKQDMAAAGIKLGGIMKPRVHVNTVQGNHATANNYWWPGQSTYSDYFSGQPVKDVNYALPGCRQWFFDHITNAFDTGIIGWWNDEADQAGGGGALFGNWQFMDMQRSLYDGQRAVSSQRVWSINRNFYLGSQRYAYAMWSGDIDGGFNAMANERARMLSSLNVGGVKWGMDIGGFNSGHLTTSECYARWMQFGALVPVYRVHGQQYNQRQPWVYGATAEAAAKAAIQLRYHLIPYIYSYERKTLETGVGIVRPYFYHWPDDAAAANYVDGWMFGEWLLASPVITQGATNHNVYLPEGTWFDYFKGTAYSGGQVVGLGINASTWSNIPLFVRKGAIIPTQPVMNYIGELPVTNIIIEAFPDWVPSAFTFYDDDGESYAYESGDWFKQRMSAQLEEGRSVFNIEAPEGLYVPELETYTCRLHGPSGTLVMVNGEPLDGYADADALAAAGGEGWYAGQDRFGHVVEVRVNARELKSIVVSNNLVSSPTFHPGAAVFQDPVSVTISSRTEGATIRFTSDGSEPDEQSSLFTEPVFIWKSTTLKAKAFMTGRDPSETSIAAYTIDNNLLRNPGFELAGLTTTNRAMYWYPGEPDSSGDMWGSARRVNWRSHEGSWQGTIRGLWANAGSDGGFWQEAEAVPGQTYRFSGWFWADSNWSAGRQGIKIEFLSGPPGSFNYVSAVTTLISGVGTTWVEKSLEATAPPGATWVRVVIFADNVGGNGALQFDALNLESLGGYSLLVQSPHGSPSPSTGTHFYGESQILTNSAGSSVEAGGTQYVCAGWTMSGNEPSSGTASVLTMSLTNHAVLNWLWVTNILEPALLDFSSSVYSVSETSGVCVVEVRRTGGTSGVVQVQYRTEDAGAVSNADYQAISGTLSFIAGQTSATFTINILDDFLFEGDESFGVQLLNPDAPGGLGGQSNAEITIVDDDPDLGSNELHVVSAYGQAEPAAGLHYVPHGAMVFGRITNNVTLSTTQFVAAGWTGSGSVPASGSGTQTPGFFITMDSEIDWLWTTNVWFERAVSGNGSIAGPDSGWMPWGTNITLQVVPATNHRFAGWSGDLDPALTNDNPLSVNLAYSRSLTANVVPLPSANLLNNPGFELAGSTSDRAANWYPGEPDTHGEMWSTALRVNWQPLQGSWHGAIRGTWSGAGDQGGFWQEVPATPGAHYRFTAWFWADDGNPWGPWYAGHQMMKMEFFSGDAMIAAVTNDLGYVNQVWQPRTLEAVAPEGADWVRVVIAAYEVGPDGALQFDQLELEILEVLPSPVVLPAAETNTTSFIAAWTGIPEATGYSLHVATQSNFLEPSWATDLFISEYGEGSGDNKVVELFNGTGADVALTNYAIWGINNGGSWPESTRPLSNVLAHGSTYVIRNAGATNAAVIAAAQQVAPDSAPMNFSGDDAVGLARNIGGATVLIDAVGTAGADPGTGWGVSGVPDATRNRTLVRQPEVRGGNINWNTCSNEWIVLDQDHFEDLGLHTFAEITPGNYVNGYQGRAVDGGISMTVTGLQPGVTYYYRVLATNDTGVSGFSGIMSVTTPGHVVIDVLAGAGGTIQPGGSVEVMVGTATSFVIAADAFYSIGRVLTNGTDALVAGSGIMTLVWHNVMSAGSVVAEFTANLTPNQTPEWWLHEFYGLTNYHEADLDDSDGDGMVAWQEYRADTDPTNQQSVLRLLLLPADDRLDIRFLSSTTRMYRLEFRPIAGEETWQAVEGHVGVMGEPGYTVLSDTNDLPHGMYRIGVSEP